MADTPLTRLLDDLREWVVDTGTDGEGMDPFADELVSRIDAARQPIGEARQPAPSEGLTAQSVALLDKLTPHAPEDADELRRRAATNRRLALADDLRVIEAAALARQSAPSEGLRVALERIASYSCEAATWANEDPPQRDRCLDPDYVEGIPDERCHPCMAAAALRDHSDSGIPTTSRELFHGHHPECGWTVDADPKACNCRVVVSTPRTETRQPAPSPTIEDRRLSEGLRGQDVHRAWRDGMLAQGREVAPERMSWDTLSQQDRDLDDGIAAALARQSAPSEGLRVAIEKSMLDIAAAMPWYDDANPDYTEAVDAIMAALADARPADPAASPEADGQ